MQRTFALFERVIVLILTGLMAAVVAVAVIGLVWTTIDGVIGPPSLFTSTEGLLDIFAAFLLVLVGLELLDTIKAYLLEHVVHAEVVYVAAMIALARKIITLDVKQVPPLTLIGAAGLTLALAAAHYLLRRTHHPLPSKADTQGGT
jgi:uncharacterized membrane protein (DUF373 family)